MDTKPRYSYISRRYVCVSAFVTRRRHTAWCWRQRHAADGIHMRCVHDGSVCDEPSKLPQAHALGGSSCGWSNGCRPSRRMNLAICCMAPSIVYNVRALRMARALRRATL